MCIFVTNPEMIIYSQMNTTISGSMNFKTDGNSRTFRFSPSTNLFRLVFISVFGAVSFCVVSIEFFTLKF